MSRVAEPATNERVPAAKVSDPVVEPTLQAQKVSGASVPVPAVSRLAAISGLVHYAALLLVIASCPFEAGYKPIGRFLWAIFTNLEAALFLLGATYLLKLIVDPAARLRLVRLPLLLPILALAGACVVSMIFGEFRSLGVQFLYRLLVGMVVYASAYEALREKRRLIIAVALFATVGVVSALFGLLEFAPGIDIQPLLKPFKPQPTTVGGMLRLSGTFEYANGAAMYFEMALPVLVGLIALLRSRIKARLSFFKPNSNNLEPKTQNSKLSEAGWWRVLLLLSFLATAVYTLALILTYSRAALVGLLIALMVFGAGVFFCRKGTSPRVVRTAYTTLALGAVVLVASGLLLFFTQPMFRLRLTTENDRGWYGATVVGMPQSQLTASQIMTVPVMITNYGLMTWPATGVLPVHVSYHWLSATDDVYLVFDGLRTGLPHDVSPGEKVSLNAIVQAPARPGNYRFQWDLVHENVSWFAGKKGMKTDTAAYSISPSTATSAEAVPPAVMPPPVTLLSNTDFASVGRGQLWKVAVDMFLSHPIAGVGPDGFRNLYGEYAGVTEWNKNIYTNNTYLEMFTDLGLLGGLAFLWLAGLALYRAARNVLRRSSGTLWLVGLGATAALTAFFAHGVVDYFLFATPLYVSFWLIMSIAVNWPNAEGDVKPGTYG